MRRLPLSSDTLWLVGICAARLGSSSSYLAYAGVLPLLQAEWGMSATAAGSISSAFLFGFAISLVVLSALADRVGARQIFLWATAATAVTTAFIPLFARSYLSGLLLFTLLALVNGGTYTPGIMLVAAALLVLLVVGVIYAFSAIGDSPVFSTGFTEVVDARILGSALAVRSLAGIGAGALATLAFGRVLDLTNPLGSAPRYPVGGWAFSVLGVGALLGWVATAWLRSLPESRRMAAGKR